MPISWNDIKEKYNLKWPISWADVKEAIGDEQWPVSWDEVKDAMKTQVILITFTVNWRNEDYILTAEEGMTFIEWVDSKYNNFSELNGYGSTIHHKNNYIAIGNRETPHFDDGAVVTNGHTIANGDLYKFYE